MFILCNFKVTLPDHDFVIANGHKLIPSVYAFLAIKPNGLGDKDSVSYSGPTFITIRSAKHSKSTALSHGRDFERLLEVEQLQSFLKYDESIKPVVIILSDGGPDENPRYQKVISVGIHHFLKHDLDALFIATNAPGRSAFNPVERRMAPLSRELSGLLLPYDKYGSHLNSQRKTTDLDLEKENFRFAGETLAEIWNKLTIDGHCTISEFVNEEDSDLKEIITKDCAWFQQHVRSSQYLLQVVKCNNLECCIPRSNYFNLLSQFLPAPIPISQIANKLGVDLKNGKFPDLGITKSLDLKLLIDKSKIPKGGNLINLQYDLFCPSMTNEIVKRTCIKCNLYFASATLVTQHNKLHKTTTKKVKPKRALRRRGDEILVEFNEEILWADECEVDLDGMEIQPALEVEEFPTITISDLFESFNNNEC